MPSGAFLATKTTIGLISFFQEAGEKLFDHKEVEQTAAKARGGDAGAQARVEDGMSTAASEPEATFYEVVRATRFRRSPSSTTAMRTSTR